MSTPPRERIANADITAIDVQNGEKASVDHTPQDPTSVPGNWGIYATPDDQTVLIDIDDYGEDPTDAERRGLEAVRELDATYTQRSPHGGTHRVYLVETDDDRPVAEHLADLFGKPNLAASWGELRTSNQYIVGAGSELSDCGKDWHDCADPETDSAYRVEEDLAVAAIHVDDLVAALVRDPEITLDTGNTERGDPVELDRSDADGVDLRVTRVAGAGHRADGSRREHPVHGSSTGTNFHIDEDDETWRCWRHGTTGNALHLVGMEAGLVDCGGWDHGRLDSDTWSEIFEAARDRGYIDDRDGRASDLVGSSGESTTDAGSAERELDEPLTESEWLDYVTRRDITDVVVKVPTDDDDDGEYETEFRSTRSVIADGGVAADEQLVAAYTDDDLRLARYQIKVEVRRTAREVVEDRLTDRDRRYVRDDAAAQKLLTRLQSAYTADGADHEARHLTVDYLDRVIDALTIPEEDDEIWLYNTDTGAWDAQGETVIASICEEALGPQWRTAVRREVLGKIRDRHRESAETAWDPRPGVADDVLPVQNGLLKLPTNKTGRAGDGPELVEHTPDARTKNALPVRYDPDATGEIFREFLLEIVDDRDAYADTLEEVIGQILLPDNRNPMLPILHGDGGNGKGVLERVLSEFVGDSLSSVELDKLEENQFAMNSMVGNMVNFVPDTDATRLNSINTLKKITGGDTVEVEPKGGDSHMTRPRTSLIFGANRPPIFPEDNYAIARRILPIPLPVRFVEDPDPDDPMQRQRDRNREQELTTNEALTDLLACALRGLERYEERGVWSHPLDADERAAEYRRESDTIVAACEDLLVECSGEKAPKAAVYDAYSNYARSRGRDPVQPSTFWKRYGKTELPSRDGRPKAPDGDGRERVIHGIALTGAAYSELSDEWRSHPWVVDGCQAAGQFDGESDGSDSESPITDERATDGGSGGSSAPPEQATRAVVELVASADAPLSLSDIIQRVEIVDVEKAKRAFKRAKRDGRITEVRDDQYTT